MRRGLTVLCAAAIAIAGIGLPAAHASNAMPVPEKDPFYAVPAGIAHFHDGQVIAARRVNAHAFELPLPAKAWQLKYRTEDFRGRPTATVTTLLVPGTAWTATKHRPLVSYQTAEDGVAGHCAPSYALRAGLKGGLTGSYTETPLIGSALLKGWAVSAPDYEGPRSEFLVAGTSGKAVIDGIRAARHFRRASLRHSPVGIWGYSGGAFATMSAAQLAPSYAPKLRIAGVAVGGLLANVRSTIDAFSGSIAGSAIPMGINGFLRAYPKLHLLSYLNAKGRAMVRQSANQCLFQAVATQPYLTISDISKTPHSLDARPVAQMLRHNSPLHRHGIPHAPIFEYHTTGDEFAPIAPVRRVLRRFCDHGAVVEHRELAVGEHLSEIAVGAPSAIDFLSARFAGHKPVNNCASIPG